MNVLLDECLPRKLRRELRGHQVRTAPEMGWSGVKNGKLLRLAEQQFDAFLTIDQNLEHQQHLSQFSIAIIVLIAPTNQIEDVQPLMPEVQRVLKSIGPGALIHVSY